MMVRTLFVCLSLLLLTATADAGQRMTTGEAFRRAAAYTRILFYHSDSCGYCLREQPELQRLTELTGVRVVPINNERDAEAFQSANITTTPTLVLDTAAAGGPGVLLSVGFATAGELAGRIEAVTRYLYREISKEELEAFFQ